MPVCKWQYSVSFTHELRAMPIINLVPDSCGSVPISALIRTKGLNPEFDTKKKIYIYILTGSHLRIAHGWFIPS